MNNSLVKDKNNENYIVSKGKFLPILSEVDLLVSGGSLSGIAAAIKYAREGYKVVLLEARTYLAWEITAKLRPWIKVDRSVNLGEIAKSLYNRISVEKKDKSESYKEKLSLHPDNLKLVLEDLLLEAGVKILYASLPVGLYNNDSDYRYSLVIGNKSGRQLIKCNTIIDSSEDKTILKLLDSNNSSKLIISKEDICKGTIEFTGVTDLDNGTMEIPEEIGVYNNKVIFHQGCHKQGHILLEYSIDISNNVKNKKMEDLEFKAREICQKITEFLISNTAQFRNAYLADASNELFLPNKIKYANSWIDSLSRNDRKKIESDLICHYSEKGIQQELELYNYSSSFPGLWFLYYPESPIDTFSNFSFGAKLAGGLIKLEYALKSSDIELNNIKLDTNGISGGELEKHLSQDNQTKYLKWMEPESPQKGRHFKKSAIPVEKIPILKHTQVLVVGGGSSGFQAAISASREGVDTSLLDFNPGPGGTGTYGGVDSFWFGRKVSFSQEIAEKLELLHNKINHNSNKWNMRVREYLLWRELVGAGVDLYFNTIVIGSLKSGDKVKGVIIATRQGIYAITAELIIDATGDGDVAAFAGADYVYGSKEEHSVMWYSLAQFSEPGKTRNNFTSSVDVSNIEDYTRAILAGRRRKRDKDCYDHGIYIAPRESRHIIGKYILTQTDQLKHRKWLDVVNIHFSNTDVKGKSSSQWIHLGLIPPNLNIEIPYSVLLPKKLTGILITGKAISVTHDALPAVRMQADLENLGGVTGLAAAMVVKEGILPHQVNIRKLQRKLVSKNILPEDVMERSKKLNTEFKHSSKGINDTTEYRNKNFNNLAEYFSEKNLINLINSLSADKPLYAYSNMAMDQVFKDKIPFVEVCTVGERIIPYLLEELRISDGKRKILIAQALAFYGNRAALPVLIEEIMGQLSSSILPVRDSHILYAGTPPDQGAMPNIVYLLYSIGLIPDQLNLPVWAKTVDLIPDNGDYTDGTLGYFYYVDSICYGMERYADLTAVPILKKLHSKKELRSQVLYEEFQIDYIPERMAMLELAIGRALASCNSKEGYQILISYLNDIRAILAEGAHSYLRRKTGEDYGKNKELWLNWLEDQDSFHL